MINIAGCMVAGAGDPAPRRVFDAVQDLGEGPASIVGDMARLTGPHAAVVNGTAAHALDFDDNYHGVPGHATAVLAPARLALVKNEGRAAAPYSTPTSPAWRRSSSSAPKSTRPTTNVAGTPQARSP